MSATIPIDNKRARSFVESREDLNRDHLIPVTDPNHDAVCSVCRFWITISKVDGTELGHARAHNRQNKTDCPHRPSNVDPTSWKDSMEADRNE